MQIFGRAGRPQFDKSGEGIIITAHDQLNHYLQLMNHQLPIESHFIEALADHLNAEIVLGTVTNVHEAVRWLNYTYLYIRMNRNPHVYGLTPDDKAKDPNLFLHCKALIEIAARKLDSCKMVRFNEATQTFGATDLGRVASHYYINHETIFLFNNLIKAEMNEGEILDMVAQATEFQNLKVRDEELVELDTLKKQYSPIPLKGGTENTHGKVNILLQSWLSHAQLDSFSLVSDSNYVQQNAQRILRALFEISLKKGFTVLVSRLLTLCKMVDQRMWDFQHPFRQFEHFSPVMAKRLEERNLTLDLLADMNPNEIAAKIGIPHVGKDILKYVRQFPYLEMDVTVQPITRTILRIQLTVIPAFNWSDRIHGTVQPWWIWVEDPQTEHIYHSEYLLLSKKQYEESANEPIKLNFTIPIFEPLPSQYYVHAVSDRWLHAETVLPISFKHLILPEEHPPHTELLPLQPLPVSALNNKDHEALYPYSHFNAPQTQVFHVLRHTDHNCLMGAPTGSGKTIVAEFAMLKIFAETPDLKVVYIGPLKALVKERMKDWEKKFVRGLGKRLVELTGDYTPDMKALQSADIICTTPEKWDGISRNWKNRSYVKNVGLVVLDEIHLLGEERGPVLEVIVSRMRYISSQTDRPVRLVGLSTALANAQDLAAWMGITTVGMFNFRPSVRPVPLEVHIAGFPGKHYCPRMQTMNKPAFDAILTHSPEKPVLIFVSSRRQTRLTARDLISHVSAHDGNPQRFLKLSEDELSSVLDILHDNSLKETLPFGIGLHHAGLTERDKDVMEELFGSNKIQILISTSTLAWGVNLPAHLVIIKGTEYFDPKTKHYNDFPITDVLQMMGRAGRPQFDNSAIAQIFVQDSKKNFYKKFLYEPFPVESSLLGVLHDHINAEIISGTISTLQDAIDYLTWTYFFRRLLRNPTYYNLDDTGKAAVNDFLSNKIIDILNDLEAAHCIEIDQEDQHIYGLTFGKIASFYYLSYKTMRVLFDSIDADSDVPSLLETLCATQEYEELPVRHNEDKLNEELSTLVPWKVDQRLLEDPHTKANLLLQAHFGRVTLPISDYITDTKSVLDQAIRILQAMVDVAADGGWLNTSLNCMLLMQMVMQGRFDSDPTTLTMPGMTLELTPQIARLLATQLGIEALPQLYAQREKAFKLVETVLPKQLFSAFKKEVNLLPLINVKVEGPLKLNEEEENSVTVTLTRVNQRRKKVFAPYYPKPKDEGWWVVLGDPEAGELHALRRVQLQQSTKTSIVFTAPSAGYHEWQVYVVSDSYLGLDQQYTFAFTSVSADFEQTPSE